MIALVNDRETGLQVGYLATDWSNYVSFDAYQKAMTDWKIQTLVRDNQPIGAVYRKDDELHVSVLPEWRCRWMTRGILRELFNRPKTVTRVTDGHDYMYGILSRLGFKQTADNWMVKEI